MKVAYGYPLMSAPPAPELVDGVTLGTIAAAVESAGFTALGLTDHPAPPDKWRRTGGHDAVDPFVGLAMAAAATTHLRLLTYLVVLPYRNPFLLAKSIASLDALSRGRVELGVGTGYQRGEFRALGVDFEERNTLFDEALRTLVAAWTGEPVTEKGEHFLAEGIASLPTPAQQPHPPIWLGGNSALTRRRVIDYGAGWLPLPNARASAHVLRSPALETLDDLAELLTDLRRRAEDAGKPAPDRVMYFLANATDDEGFRTHRETIARLPELGVDWVYVNGHGRTEKEALTWIERYQEAVLSRIPAA